jgi:hypothetical protein
MRDVPGCIRERRYSITHVLPTADAWSEAQARARGVAQTAVRKGYRVVGHGKNWRIVLDPVKSRLLNT